MSSNNPPMPNMMDQATTQNSGRNNDQSGSPDNSQPISSDDLNVFLHDMNGPLASARGFTEELVNVRRCMKDLIEKPNSGIDSELLASLQDQIDNEMEFCLERVERSLVNLDSIIESIRVRSKASG